MDAEQLHGEGEGQDSGGEGEGPGPTHTPLASTWQRTSLSTHHPVSPREQLLEVVKTCDTKAESTEVATPCSCGQWAQLLLQPRKAAWRARRHDMGGLRPRQSPSSERWP